MPDLLTGFSDRLESPSDWLAPFRREARERLKARGLPTSREEAWRYTPLSALPAAEPRAGAGLDAKALGHLLFGDLPSPRLVFVNGRFVPGLSDAGSLPSGVVLGSLAEAIGSRRDLLEPHLGRQMDLSAHPFAALNAAALIDGAFLSLAGGAALERPVHLVFVSDAKGGGPVLSQPRVLIVAGQDSRAVVAETYLSTSAGPCVTNAVSEIVLARGASVEHIRLQREGEGAFHLGMLQVRQAARSLFTSHAVALGASLARCEIHVRLEGERASATLNGLSLGTGTQHLDALTVVDHVAPHCTSAERYKGIWYDRARGVFFGRIHVAPHAQGTDARQASQNLLLSEEAEVDARPQLEIHADDVSCSHGVTIGRLDAAALFYLRSRGLSADSARSLLTHAFAEEMVDRIPDPAVRCQLAACLCAWLTQHLGSEVRR